MIGSRTRVVRRQAARFPMRKRANFREAAYLQKSLNGAALNCVYLVVYWIDRWPS
jgi:hypothetical protein